MPGAGDRIFPSRSQFAQTRNIIRCTQFKFPESARFPAQKCWCVHGHRMEARKSMSNLEISALRAAVAGSAAAFRSITQLQPVGGEGDKVFPATYSQGKYATEQRRIKVKNGEVEAETEVGCVLINSVQSQANHAEE